MYKCATQLLLNRSVIAGNKMFQTLLQETFPANKQSSHFLLLPFYFGYKFSSISTTFSRLRMT